MTTETTATETTEATATTTATEPQPAEKPKPTAKKTTAKATKPEAKPSEKATAKATERAELDAKVRGFLQSHKADEFGPWAIVQALKMVPEGISLAEADAKHGRPYDRVHGSCDRLVAEGVVRVAQVKPARYTWTGRAKPLKVVEATAKA